MGRQPALASDPVALPETTEVSHRERPTTPERSMNDQAAPPSGQAIPPIQTEAIPRALRAATRTRTLRPGTDAQPRPWRPRLTHPDRWPARNRPADERLLADVIESLTFAVEDAEALSRRLRSNPFAR